MPADSKELVIALDQGSSSSRALAFDSKGRVIARAQFPVKTFYPKPGWAEHDPEDLAGSQERALDAVLGRIPRSAHVLGLGIASQRSTIVLWDGRTGKSICPAPSWQDGRAADLIRSLPDRQEFIFEDTGLYLTPYYSAPKIRWLLDRVPKARRLSDSGSLRAAPVASYLAWRLTRGAVFAADPSLAQRTLLFDSRTLQWDERLLKLFGISGACLPQIRPSAGDFGTIDRKGRKIPILAMLGDQQAAALGLGADHPGSAVLNYGTGAFFLLHAGDADRRIPGILSSVAWQRPGERRPYFLEGPVLSAGTSFQWLQKNLGLLKNVDAVGPSCRRSKNRILALQAIGGLGAPRWDYSTFTTFMGMNSKTRPEDLVRAVTESIAFSLAEVVAAVRAGGLKADSIRASGGLSRINHLLQFQSDLLQTPIARVKESETTASGVASLAAQAARAPWAALLRRSKIEKLFMPAMSRDESDRLLRGWKLFVETQQRLSSGLRELGVLS